MGGQWWDVKFLLEALKSSKQVRRMAKARRNFALTRWSDLERASDTFACCGHSLLSCPLIAVFLFIAGCVDQSAQTNAPTEVQ